MSVGTPLLCSFIMSEAFCNRDGHRCEWRDAATDAQADAGEVGQWQPEWASSRWVTRSDYTHCSNRNTVTTSVVPLFCLLLIQRHCHIFRLFSVVGLFTCQSEESEPEILASPLQVKWKVTQTSCQESVRQTAKQAGKHRHYICSGQLSLHLFLHLLGWQVFCKMTLARLVDRNSGLFLWFPSWSAAGWYELHSS